MNFVFDCVFANLFSHLQNAAIMDFDYPDAAKDALDSAAEKKTQKFAWDPTAVA